MIYAMYADYDTRLITMTFIDDLCSLRAKELFMTQLLTNLRYTMSNVMITCYNNS